MGTIAPPPPAPLRDDAEALIEEARRRTRRRRRRGALLALALAALAGGIALGSGGGGGSGLPTHAGSGSGGGASRARREQEVRAILRAAAHDTLPEAYLIAPGVAWGMNGLAFYVTDNGGRSWRVAEPAFLGRQDVIAKVGDVATRGPNRLWLPLGNVIGTHFVGGSDRYATIARTSDGGRIWRAAAPPGCAHGCDVSDLSFISAARGFAMTAGGAHGSDYRLYTTRDAGASWLLVSHTPFAGPITFTSARDGFGVSDPINWVGPEENTPVGGGLLYRTADGGRSWQRVELAPPPADADLPAIADSVWFFGRRDGLVPVRYRDRRSDTQHLVVFATTDGGRSWSAHPTPPLANLRSDQWGVVGAVAFSAPGARRWLFFAGSTLYATADAGRHWSATAAPIAGIRPYDISFTSLEHGWAIFPIGSNGRLGLALVSTSNGGRTWTPVPTPTLPPQRS